MTPTLPLSRFALAFALAFFFSFAVVFLTHFFFAAPFFFLHFFFAWALKFWPASAVAALKPAAAVKPSRATSAIAISAKRPGRVRSNVEVILFPDW